MEHMKCLYNVEAIETLNSSYLNINFQNIKLFLTKKYLNQYFAKVAEQKGSPAISRAVSRLFSNIFLQRFHFVTANPQQSFSIGQYIYLSLSLLLLFFSYGNYQLCVLLCRSIFVHFYTRSSSGLFSLFAHTSFYVYGLVCCILSVFFFFWFKGSGIIKDLGFWIFVAMFSHWFLGKWVGVLQVYLVLLVHRTFGLLRVQSF